MSRPSRGRTRDRIKLHRGLLLTGFACLIMVPLTGCLRRSDSMAPIVSITEPKSGTTRTTDDLNIVGYAMDDAGVAAIRINGTDVLNDPAYEGERGERLVRFRFTVGGLQDGKVNTTIDVTDVNGRTSVLDYELTIDNTAPAVEITAASAVAGGQYHVEGRATDNTSVTSIRINGQPLAFTPGPEVNFSVDVAAQDDGVVIVEDSAGNSVSRALP